MIRRPNATEYVPYFAGYVAFAEEDPFAQLSRQTEAIARAAGLPDGAGSARPAPGEWSLKEVLVHLCDFERMFNYRALRFSRGDTTPVEAFEQDPYVAASGANFVPLEHIVQEFLALREATRLMFLGMADEMYDRRGTAGGNEVSVRALLFIIAGHCEGHLEDLRRNFPEFKRS